MLRSGVDKVNPEDAAVLRDLRNEVNAFLRTHWGEAAPAPTCDAWLTGYDRDFTRALGAAGLIGVSWPRELGGRDLPVHGRLAIVEELLRHGAPVAAHWIAERQIGPALLRYGSPELQREFLPAIARGDVTFSICMSETEAGSDLAAVRTRAEPDDHGWRITGNKIWTSHAHRAEYAYVLARTDGAGDKHDGLTEFIVPLDAPGVSVSPIRDLRGDHHFNEVRFDGVRVPARYVIGDVGAGWAQVTEQLAFERGGMERVMSTFPVIEHLVARIPAADRILREEVGTLLARFDALREMAWSATQRMAEGDAPVTEAARLKLLGTRFERDVLEVARRVVRDVAPDPTGNGLARALADGVAAAPGFTLRGGTSEVLLRIIGREECSDRSGVSSVQGAVVAETAALREVVDRTLTDRATPDGGDAPAASHWQTATQAGWHRIGLCGAAGGDGGGITEVATIVGSLAAHAASSPIIEHHLASWVLHEAERIDLVDLDTTTLMVPPGEGQLSLARIGAPGGRLRGRAERVPWARAADRLVLYVTDEQRDALVVVETDDPAVKVVPGANLAGEPRDAVVFDGVNVPASRIIVDPPARTTIQLRAGTLTAAGIMGAARTARSLAVRHATGREQFGRPLSRFELVAAHLAEVGSHLALGEVIVERACAAHDAMIDRLVHTAAAKVVTSRMAGEIAERTHQVLGAMGTTQEHPLHRSTLRLLSWRDEWGAEHEWARALGDYAGELGFDEFWAVLTL